MGRLPSVCDAFVRVEPSGHGGLRGEIAHELPMLRVIKAVAPIGGEGALHAKGFLLATTVLNASMAEEPRFRVLLFASAREAVGRSSVQLSYRTGERLSTFLERLFRTYPALGRPQRYRYALNGEFVEGSLDEVRLIDAEELAVLPPYSGG